MSKPKSTPKAPTEELVEITKDDVGSLEEIIGTTEEPKMVESPISMEDYLEQIRVNAGLIASYKYEARTEPSMLTERTKTEWDAAFEAQANRGYL